MCKSVSQRCAKTAVGSKNPDPNDGRDAPNLHGARHLSWLQEELGPQFTAGALLHTGRRRYQLADHIQALPIATLWT